MEYIKIEVFSKDDFRKWLEKNHDKENKISLVIHKKHTGKKSPSHRELMEEAICFGWIDTTVKRIDENRYLRNFSRRGKNSTWSKNTLSYARDLIKKGRMTPYGLHFYKEGLKKLPHDHGIPENPGIPTDLQKELDSNKTAKENFNKLAPSLRRTYLRWLFRAKLPETRKKRISSIVKRLSKEKVKVGTWSKLE